MAFVAPLYLIALLPWAGLAVWMLVGRRRRQWVPFLALWNAPEEIRRPKKGFEPPPLALILTLVSLLLGVLAAARPQWQSSANQPGRVAVIIDRGATMSAISGGRSRLESLAQSVGPILLEKFGPGDIELIDPIDGSVSQHTRTNWFQQTSPWKRTALQTADALRETARQCMQQAQPTLLLSDQNLNLPGNDQLVQIKPTSPVNNAGISLLSHKPGQVMVRIQSSAETSRTITLRSGPRTASLKVDLHAGKSNDFFIDFPAAADVIEAKLEGVDGFEADDRAWILRSRAWPMVEPRSPISDELTRMIDIYAKHRPTREVSLRLALAQSGELKSDEPGIVLAPTTGEQSPNGVVTRSDHPILAGVDLSPLEQSSAIASQSPGEGWNVIASQRGKPILAVRDGATRQVWIGFDSATLARSPAFVVFWTNVFDWAGAGGEGFASGTVDQSLAGQKRSSPEQLSDDIDARYWPGIFETSSGQLAANAPVPQFATANTNWQADISRLKAGAASGVPLAPWAAVAALLFLLAAAVTWEKRRVAATVAAAHLDVETIKHVQTVFAADSHIHRHKSETRPS